MHYEVHTNPDGTIRWTLKHDGKPLARSAQNFTNDEACEESIAEFEAGRRNADVVIEEQ